MPDTTDGAGRPAALCRGRGDRVVARGEPRNADLVLVGEAPGLDEDLLGKPFVGAAGTLLTNLLFETRCGAATSTSATS